MSLHTAGNLHKTHYDVIHIHIATPLIIITLSEPE